MSETLTVKARLFGYLREADSASDPDKRVYTRDAASYGDKVTSDPAPTSPEEHVHYGVSERSIDRGKALDAFFTEADMRKAALIAQLQAEAGVSQDALAQAVGGGTTLPPHLMSVPNAVGHDALAATGSQGGPPPAESVEVAGLDDDRLAAYLTLYRPNVEDTVALAGNDKELAYRILEAEKLATGEDSRSGVVKGLTAVIERENQ